MGAAPLPLLAHIFFSKSRFFRVKAYISLCAFATIEDKADKLSSAPFSKFLDPPLDLKTGVLINTGSTLIQTANDEERVMGQRTRSPKDRGLEQAPSLHVYIQIYFQTGT